LRVLPDGTEFKKHDHFDLIIAGQDGRQVLRLHDPRRFGAVLWHGKDEGELDEHLLLRGLGVEPLDDGFSGELLFRATRKRKAPIKQVLLAGDIVVGVGKHLRLRKPVPRRHQPEDSCGPHKRGAL
jgi:formamidopyrimidine-DNA glycosylase